MLFEMSTLERVSFLLFVGAVATVFVAAAGSVVRLVYERLKRRPAPRSPFVRWFRRVSVALGAVGVACVLYGRLVEPYRLTETRVPLSSAKIPAGSRPIRVVHISDLHCDPSIRLENRLPEAIAAARPDLVVFTGDAINSPGGLENFRSVMTRIAAIAPTFAVRGNWDVWFWNRIDLYAGTGVRELDGSGAEVTVGDTRIWVCGTAVEHEGLQASAVAAAPAGDYCVYLQHYPDEIEEVAALGGADLYCAGHTHGGQVALPGYGALLTFSRFGKRFEAGQYRVGDTWLYVNRGIGMEGGDAPRVRFWAPPEITLFEIAPAQTSDTSPKT